VPEPSIKGLRSCETRLEVSGELQWRQVHPNEVDDGQVTPAAFRGTSKDRDAISCCRSAKRTAAQAYDDYTGGGKLSQGTFAVTIAEVTAASCQMIDDADCEDVTTVGHSVIRMHHFTTKDERREARVMLAAYANKRGVQHPR